MLVKFYVLTAVLLVHLRGFYTEAIGANKQFMLVEDLTNSNKYVSLALLLVSSFSYNAVTAVMS